MMGSLAKKWHGLRQENKLFIGRETARLYLEYAAEHGLSPDPAAIRAMAGEVRSMAAEKGIRLPKKTMENHVHKFLENLMQGKPVQRRLRKIEEGMIKTSLPSVPPGDGQ